ncbi:AMP-binding protein [Neobacillus novalis]|uniref:AMP-binding protein n=1 Tax=Neobacillus novalis TaxID=220687 RepID=A0AA95MLB6_9BACI|nr:AMP-binding protein [Neobacillus novalis]WHY83995.1 AMP-binding protein [Neobacillus novalis]
MSKRKVSYYHSPGEIFPLGRTFGDVIEKAAEEFPNKVFIYYEDRTITYGQLHKYTNVIALNLIKNGFKKGDRLGICLPDWPEYSLIYYACAKTGIITMPVSPRYREKEFLMILGHSGAKHIILPANSDFDFVGMVEELKQNDLKELENIIVVGKNESIKESPYIFSFDHLIKTDLSNEEVNEQLAEYLKENSVDADSLLEICYTSGTTGAPKGVMATHNNRIAAGTLNNESWGARPSDIMIAMAPLAHSTGSNHSQNGALLGNFSVVYLGSWKPEKTLEQIERFGATILIGVPAMFISIMNHPNFLHYNVKSVRGTWCAGSPVAISVAKKISSTFNSIFIQCYGTTECGGNHCTKPEDPIELSCGSGGPPVRGTEAKVIDPDGNIVPIGQPGEVCARGVTRMLGYYNNPGANETAIDRAGWFHSGDLGVMNELGYIKIIGRIKDMIIRGGENIYISEMEEAIYQYPDIQEVHVVGYPDAYLGERTCAFIRAKSPDTIITRDDLVKFLNEKIAKYKIPDKVVMVKEFPVSHSGKIQKFKLQNMLTKEEVV